MALFNNFPYSNTEEINLDYTLNKLNELYSRGENLYAELQSWKTATDEANEAWKSDLLSDINEWQNSVTHSLEEWKNSVDSEVANALTSLSNQITAELNQAKTDLRNEVADLASAAAASASDAAAGQSAAAQSAQTAVNSAAAAAQSEQNISESAEQIEINKNDITDLKSAINIIEVGYKQYLTSDIIQGSYNADGSVAPNQNRIRISGFVELNTGDTLRFKPGTNTASLLYGLYNENKDFQRDSPWYSSEHTITTDKHIYVICIFKNSTGTSITPADFDATVVKTLSTKNAIVNLSEMLDVSVSPTTDQIIENRFITADGTLSSESVNFNATDYLNIRDIVSDSLTIRGTVYGYAGFSIYDANRTVLLSVTGNNASDYGITPTNGIQTFSIPRPAESYYARLSAWKSAYTQPSDLKVIGGGYGDLNSRLSFVERKIDSIDTGTLSDKKVLVIGDSISTDAYGNYRKWVTDLINTGFFDGEKVTNSSQHATGFVARYDNRPNDFITRLKAIENPSQYDLVVAFGGINDYIQSIPMGSESGTDYTVSFKPAVNEFFNYLIENFTQARLCVLLPLRTYATWVNSVDEYQQAYGDYIKTVAKSYCLPVLNLTEDSGFFPWKTTFRNMWTLQPEGYESHDGVHPNEEYQSKYLAPMIKGFLKGLL